MFKSLPFQFIIVIYFLSFFNCTPTEYQLNAHNFSKDYNVNSPDGSIPDGARAYSLDGKYYLCEIKPYYYGHIGVFKKKNDSLIQSWNVLDSSPNDLKGLAWDQSSTKFAIMYHGGSKPGITIFKIGNSTAIGNVQITKTYHYILFDSDQYINVSVDLFDIESLEITYSNQ